MVEEIPVFQKQFDQAEKSRFCGGGSRWRRRRSIHRLCIDDFVVTMMNNFTHTIFPDNFVVPIG